MLLRVDDPGVGKAGLRGGGQDDRAAVFGGVMFSGSGFSSQRPAAAPRGQRGGVDEAMLEASFHDDILADVDQFLLVGAGPKLDQRPPGVVLKDDLSPNISATRPRVLIAREGASFEIVMDCIANTCLSAHRRVCHGANDAARSSKVSLRALKRTRHSLHPSARGSAPFPAARRVESRAGEDVERPPRIRLARLEHRRYIARARRAAPRIEIIAHARRSRRQQAFALVQRRFRIDGEREAGAARSSRSPCRILG